MQHDRSKQTTGQPQNVSTGKGRVNSPGEAKKPDYLLFARIGTSNKRIPLSANNVAKGVKKVTSNNNKNKNYLTKRNRKNKFKQYDQRIQTQNKRRPVGAVCRSIFGGYQEFTLLSFLRQKLSRGFREASSPCRSERSHSEDKEQAVNIF